MFRNLTFALTLLASSSAFSQFAEHEPSEQTNGRIAWTLFTSYGGNGIYSVGPTGLHEIQVTIPGPGSPSHRDIQTEPVRSFGSTRTAAA